MIKTINYAPLFYQPVFNQVKLLDFKTCIKYSINFNVLILIMENTTVYYAGNSTVFIYITGVISILTEHTTAILYVLCINEISMFLLYMKYSHRDIAH